MNRRPFLAFGTYDDQMKLSGALEKLSRRRFRPDSVSIHFLTPQAIAVFRLRASSRAPEGAMYGGAGGIVFGAVLGWYSGAGSIVIPGLGILIAAGPLLGSLAGAGAGGLLAGVAGALVGLGVRTYQTKVARDAGGGLVLVVRCENRERQHEVKRILRASGARRITGSSAGLDGAKHVIPSEAGKMPSAGRKGQELRS